MLGDERASLTQADDAAAATSLRATYHASQDNFTMGLTFMGAAALRWLEPTITAHQNWPPTPSATVAYGWNAHEIFLAQHVAGFRAQSSAFSANSVPQNTTLAWSAIVRLIVSYVTISKLLVEDGTPAITNDEKRALRDKIFGNLYMLPYYPTTSTNPDALRAIEGTLTTIAYGGQQLQNHRQILLFDRVNDKLRHLHDFLLKLRPGEVLRLPPDVLKRLTSRKHCTLSRFNLRLLDEATATTPASTSTQLHAEQKRKRQRTKRNQSARRHQPPPPLRTHTAPPPPLHSYTTSSLSPRQPPPPLRMTIELPPPLRPPAAPPPPPPPISCFRPTLSFSSLSPAAMPLSGVPATRTPSPHPQRLAFSPSTPATPSAMSPALDLATVCCFNEMDDDTWSWLDDLHLTSPPSLN